MLWVKNHAREIPVFASTSMTILIFFAAIVLLTLLVAPTGPRRVPYPNPKDPVDYFAWVNGVHGVPDTMNAASIYEKLADEWREYAFPAEEGDGTEWTFFMMEQRRQLTQQLYDAEYRPWSSSQFALSSAWIKSKADALDQIRLASQKHALFLPYGPMDGDRTFVTMDTSSSTDIRGAIRHLLIQGWENAHDGNTERLMENALTVLRIAHQLRAPDLLALLTKDTWARKSYEGMLGALKCSSDPGALASRRLQPLVECEKPWGPFGEQFAFDRINAFSFLQEIGEWDESQQKNRISRLRTEFWQDRWNKLAECKFDLPDIVDAELKREIAEDDNDIAEFCGLKTVRVRGWESVSFDETVAEFDVYFRLLEDWMDRPFIETAGRPSPADLFAHRSTNPIVRFYLFGSCNSGLSYESQRGRMEEIIAQQRGVRCVLAIWAYHHARGTFPESLASIELDDGIIDPFSGEPFRYRNAGSNFTLYSIGPDLVDDGGKHSSAWGFPVQFPKRNADAPKTGGDFVFWPWSHEWVG